MKNFSILFKKFFHKIFKKYFHKIDNFYFLLYNYRKLFSFRGILWIKQCSTSNYYTKNWENPKKK